MADYRSYDPHIVGSSGDDLLTRFTHGDESWPFWAPDLIEAGAGRDTIDGSTGADTIVGGAGDDLITGGVGAPFPGQSDDDVFVYAFERTGSATYEQFRGGDHPSDHANGRAWENYADQAQARGYDAVIGHTEGGHALYGRLVEGAVGYRPLDGHDTITDFDGAGGETLHFTGVGAENEAAFRSHLTFEAGVLYYDDTPLMTLQGVQTFDPAWITVS